MKNIIIAVVLGLSPLLVYSQPQYAGKRKQVEVVAREGIGHTLEKIRAGKEVTVAYFGGSITSMDGWRRLSFEWLKEKYPNAKFKMIHAAIGGTTSSLGVFRCQKNVLAEKPDLVFIEFTCNDSSLSPEVIWENYDGIIRQIWQHDPKTDIVCTYTTTESMLKTNSKGLLTDSQTATDMIAEYYGIPSVAFGVRIAEEVKSGRMVTSIRAVKDVAPDTTSSDVKEVIKNLEKRGQTLFAEDGVHPALPGHGFYLKAIQAFWKAAENIAPTDHARHLAMPYYSDRLTKAKLVAPTKEMMRGSWRKLPLTNDRIGYIVGPLWQTDTPGDTIEFSFRGSECKLFDMLGPNGGYVKINVDGKEYPRVKRFDSYCRSWRLGDCAIFKGENAVHHVRIELAKEVPDRREILRRHPNADLTEAKFHGTCLKVGMIELVGDLID